MMFRTCTPRFRSWEGLDDGMSNLLGRRPLGGFGRLETWEYQYIEWEKGVDRRTMRAPREDRTAGRDKNGREL